MRVFLVFFLLISACASNSERIERIKADYPDCAVDSDGNVTCPLPTEPDKPYEKLSKKELGELDPSYRNPVAMKVLVSCKLRQEPTMNSKQVGFLARGITVPVERVDADWYSYYTMGRLVYIGSKCFKKGGR